MPALEPYNHESLLIDDLKMQLQEAAKAKGTVPLKFSEIIMLSSIISSFLLT